MQTVQDILQIKGHATWSIGPKATVYDALQLMADKDVGALLVLEDGRLAGIFSERDYARKIILKGKSSRETAVREIMTEQVISVHPEQTVVECMALMTNHRVRHLPVLEASDVVGVISIGDAVKSIISDQQFTIEQLEKYITGQR
jgi:CBS domain-containing protein